MHEGCHSADNRVIGCHTVIYMGDGADEGESVLEKNTAVCNVLCQ